MVEVLTTALTVQQHSRRAACGRTEVTDSQRWRGCRIVAGVMLVTKRNKLENYIETFLCQLEALKTIPGNCLTTELEGRSGY